MRVLLVNQYFWPDMAATAQLLADLAEDLAAAGHEVTALAGRGTYVAGRAGRLPRRERWQGVEIRRVACTDFGRLSRLGALGRLADYLTFLAAAAIAVLTVPRQDVVVCLSTPPLVAMLGLLARRRRGTRFVYKVEDLYPDLGVALGALPRRSPLTRGLAALSARLLSGADAVVTLDDAMAAQVRTRAPQRRALSVTVIPNWADGEAIVPDAAAGARFRREHDIPESMFVVLYSGNLGLAHRFDAVAGAAHRLAARAPEVLWLIVGGGPALADLAARVAGLGSVRFLGYQPRQRLNELYNAADLHLVTLRDEVTGLLVPSKYAATLAAGKPVLLVGGEGSDLQAEIVARGLGWISPHTAEAVVEAVTEGVAARRRDGRREAAGLAARGQAARRVFDERYSRRRAFDAWSRLLEGL
jgi:glycosyltransferase involved in cell wall biosynthesis